MISTSSSSSILTSKSSSDTPSLSSKSNSEDSEPLDNFRPSSPDSRRGDDMSYGVKSLNFLGDVSSDSAEMLASDDEEDEVAGPIERCKSSRWSGVNSPKLLCLNEQRY